MFDFFDIWRENCIMRNIQIKICSQRFDCAVHAVGGGVKDGKELTIL